MLYVAFRLATLLSCLRGVSFFSFRLFFPLCRLNPLNWFGFGCGGFPGVTCASLTFFASQVFSLLFWNILGFSFVFLPLLGRRTYSKSTYLPSLPRERPCLSPLGSGQVPCSFLTGVFLPKFFYSRPILRFRVFFSPDASGRILVLARSRNPYGLALFSRRRHLTGLPSIYFSPISTVVFVFVHFAWSLSSPLFTPMTGVSNLFLRGESIRVFH